MALSGQLGLENATDVALGTLRYVCIIIIFHTLRERRNHLLHYFVTLFFFLYGTTGP